MSRETTIRLAALYLPIVLALLAGLLRRRRPRQFVACLLSLLWTLPTLLILQRLNLHFLWWTFHTSGPTLLGMPLELYLGWAILWGLVPQLTFPRLDLPEVLALMALFDIFSMAFCAPVLHLNPQTWLIGEAAALALILAPAFCLFRWTRDNTRLNLRATLQIALSGMLFLFLLPEIVFALKPGPGWSPLLRTPLRELQLYLQFLLLLALPGVSAVAEFAQRGRGTPIPYDPPQRLVTTGIYRFCANPMQLSCALVMLLWAAMLHNLWFLLATLMATVYSAGLAAWDEHHDLAARFHQPWNLYRRAVPAWRLRWRPFHTGPPALLYIAHTCGPCSQLRAWIEARKPLGLTLIDAETLPSIRRLTYDPADGTPLLTGVRAFASALEHLNLGWAYCGLVLRLPLVWQSIQLLLDATGLGPRTLPQPPAKPLIKPAS